LSFQNRSTLLLTLLWAGGACRWAPEDGADEHLVVMAPATRLLYEPGELVHRIAVRTGPALDELPVSLGVQRDHDGAWLSSDCGSESCWQERATAWATWQPGELPDRMEFSYFAEEQQPRLVKLHVWLFMAREGQDVPLARASSRVHELGRHLAWGELHNHTNLSYDACEDPEASCGPLWGWPGEEVFLRAEENGLNFAALTDHAEFDTYLLQEEGLELDIHEETLRLVAEAESGPVLPVTGFEWTAFYSGEGSGSAGGHRTVLFEDADPCQEFWIPGSTPEARKDDFGRESYLLRDVPVANTPAGLLSQLEEAASSCGQARRISYFHHPGMQHPVPVDWGHETSWVEGDVLVEIHSEHGSSECFDLTLPGCDWNIDASQHEPFGAVQRALQHGHLLGFVGGTDNHEANPGSVEDGGGPVAATGGQVEWKSSAGSLTAALHAGWPLERATLFDALEARNTLAASWRFERLRVAARGADGQLYLPGSDVPEAASPLHLIVDLEDPHVESWRAELVDPWNELWLELDGPFLPEPFDLARGEVRYLRLRVELGGEEQRVWASPFFGVP